MDDLEFLKSVNPRVQEITAGKITKYLFYIVKETELLAIRVWVKNYIRPYCGSGLKMKSYCLEY